MSVGKHFRELRVYREAFEGLSPPIRNPPARLTGDGSLYRVYLCTSVPLARRPCRAAEGGERMIRREGVDGADVPST